MMPAARASGPELARSTRSRATWPAWSATTPSQARAHSLTTSSPPQRLGCPSLLSGLRQAPSTKISAVCPSTSKIAFKVATRLFGAAIANKRSARDAAT